jgi:hypothetical protein
METGGRDGEVHTKTLGMNLILMRIDHYNLIFFKKMHLNVSFLSGSPYRILVPHMRCIPPHLQL